ncbi:MAG: hypothetical protein L6R38_001948 [Xanthoria sp. 2 TBL-2021]|nr:MAG: hypothetical protein L6R38_001948 [Xanthoria sp. 2 TBL-2021]
MSTIAVPAILAGQTNSSLLVSHWNSMFRAGSKVGPTLVALGAVNYLYAAWGAYNSTYDTRVWKGFAAAGVSTMAVAPYTVVFLSSTNSALLGQAAKTTLSEVQVRGLVEQWAFLNLLRSGIPIVSTALGLYGALGLTGKVVTILVGTAETPFSIHWGLLTSKSTFFNAALTGSWKESSEGKIRLVEDDPELFSTYVLCIYNQDWTLDQNGKALSSDAHCRLYIMADKFGSEASQNLIIDNLRERATRSKFEMRFTTFGYVYDNTLPGNPLRKLLADFLAWKLSLPYYKSLVDVAPQCLYDALEVYEKRLSLGSKATTPYHDTVACKNYHIHQDGTSCSSLVAPNASKGKST